MRQLTLRLCKRKDGRYCKWINGRMVYFGRDERLARAMLLDLVRRQTLGHLEPDQQVPLHELADHYHAACQLRISDGTMQARTLDDYTGAIREFLRSVGRTRLVSSLGADDFSLFRSALARRLGCYALDRNIVSIRRMFRWAAENRVIDREPIYGSGFRVSSRADKRFAQAKHESDHGPRVFNLPEIDAILDAAREPMRTMILLGLNCGMYSIDCSDLLWSDIREVDGVTMIDRRRAKTGVVQRAPLWPEVLQSLGIRRVGRVFSTRRGNAWNRRNGTDSIAMEFGKMRHRAGVTRAGLGFGALRHTHVSAVSELPDINACRMVRGHQILGIESHYDFPSLERLLAVTSHARSKILRTPSAPPDVSPSSLRSAALPSAESVAAGSHRGSPAARATDAARSR
jgi:integrase